MRDPTFIQPTARVLRACAAATLVLAGCTPQANPTQPQATSPVHAPGKTGVVAAAPTRPDRQRSLANMQGCRARLETAMRDQVVSNASVDNGRPILWVGPGWKATSPAIRDKVVRDTACFFVSGDETQTIRFSVYDMATDQELAVWNHTHLVTP